MELNWNQLASIFLLRSLPPKQWVEQCFDGATNKRRRTTTTTTTIYTHFHQPLKRGECLARSPGSKGSSAGCSVLLAVSCTDERTSERRRRIRNVNKETSFFSVFLSSCDSIQTLVALGLTGWLLKRSCAAAAAAGNTNEKKIINKWNGNVSDGKSKTLSEQGGGWEEGETKKIAQFSLFLFRFFFFQHFYNNFPNEIELGHWNIANNFLDIRGTLKLNQIHGNLLVFNWKISNTQ